MYIGLLFSTTRDVLGIAMKLNNIVIVTCNSISISIVKQDENKLPINIYCKTNIYCKSVPDWLKMQYTVEVLLTVCPSQPNCLPHFWKEDCLLTHLAMTIMQHGHLCKHTHPCFISNKNVKVLLSYNLLTITLATTSFSLSLSVSFSPLVGCQKI